MFKVMLLVREILGIINIIFSIIIRVLIIFCYISWVFLKKGFSNMVIIGKVNMVIMLMEMFVYCMEVKYVIQCIVINIFSLMVML